MATTPHYASRKCYTSHMKTFQSFMTRFVPAPTAQVTEHVTEQVTEQVRYSDQLTVGFGRFNPPTVGHELLLDKIQETADGGEYHIYPSQSQDSKKNPLDFDTKVSYMRKMYPEHASHIVKNSDMKTIFDVLQSAYTKGYTTIKLVVGEDRKAEFSNLVEKYNGSLYSFESIEVVSAGKRDPDSDGVEGMSASKLRQAAYKGDYETFREGISASLSDRDTKKLYDHVRKVIGAEDVKGLWEIAPKFDWKGLRDNFVNGDLFQVGALVESLNTGMVGKIIRRGANHIICLTKEGYLFKSWARDLNEVHEVGTDSYREYVQRMTPREKVRSFINKSIKKRKSSRS